MTRIHTNAHSQRTFYFCFIFLALVCLGFMFAEIINHRFWMSDFEVYYKAAQRISGGENLYQHAEDGHYIFKYSPASALLFTPFIVFSYEAAKCIYWLLLTFLLVYGFYLCIRQTRPLVLAQAQKKVVNAVVLAATFILAVHFLRELHLGQVNYLLLFTYVLAWHCLNTDRWKRASVLLGLSIFIKPFALIFLPYLLVKKKYREMGLFILTAVVFALLPVLFYGTVETTMGQYGSWITELKTELGHKQSLLAGSNHTIFSVLARYTPLRWCLDSGIAAKIYQVVVLGLLAAYGYYFVKVLTRKTGQAGNTRLPVTDLALLTSSIPLLAFTSENAFIYTMVLVFVVLLYFHRFRVYEKILAVTGFLFIGGNFSELTGKELSAFIDSISLISIGALILLYLLFIVKKRGWDHQA